MKLQLYFARKFMKITLGIFLVFAAFMTLLDMVEQMRRFDALDLSFWTALKLSMLSVPEALYSILPLVVMLATLALFLGLARTSELVVARAAGRSAIRSMFAPTVAAALFGVMAVLIFNPIVAATKHAYERQVAAFSGEGDSVLSVSQEGLWLRQGDANGQSVIRAQRVNTDGTEFYGFTIIDFAPDETGKLIAVRRAEAARAELLDDTWNLTDVKLWPLSFANPEPEASYHATLVLPSSLSTEGIRKRFGEPTSVPIWDLPAYIRDLERAGFSARQHRVWFQTELAQPLFLAAMVMIGAGFTMRHTRFGRTGLMVLFALLMGFSAFFIRNFAQILGENGDIPISLAAWAPPAAAIMMSLGLLLHLEDG
jgi:lipopolysaccharide export system permease protein